MRVTETIQADPISTEKSVRADEIRALTTCKAGKIVPVSYIPLLREDRVSRGQIRLRLDMAETIHPLMNAVNVTAFAHFVPFSAFERFSGMDAFNRSYQGVPEPHDNTPIPFFRTMNFNRDAEFWRTMGIHWKNGSQINSAPVEAYNTLVNFRRRTRSKHLPLREWNWVGLAEAFWKNPNLWHIVPDYEQAMLDGQVTLSVNNAVMPVQGIGVQTSMNLPANTSRRIYNGETESAPWAASLQKALIGAQPTEGEWTAGLTHATFTRLKTVASQVVPDVFVELEAQGLQISLANIELAKQTVAFAKLREAFKGMKISDDHLVDLLMEGIRVPEESMRQPILLAKSSTIFGYTERHAMDGANLAKSVTTGRTELSLTFRTPAMNTGGIIMITVEIVPEQLFERMKDQFLAINDPNRLPNFLRDYPDPEKVEHVRNDYVDVEHAQRAGLFGYAPLNHAWKRSLARVGGRYYRPLTAGFVEDRQRFWSVEQINPALTTDFYLVRNLPHTVFADALADPFEILATGRVEIVGNTVFGKTLMEDGGEFEAVDQMMDKNRIAIGGAPVGQDLDDLPALPEE